MVIRGQASEWVLVEDVEWVSRAGVREGENVPGQGETMYLLVTFLWGVSLFWVF